jgi:hypothetical protein
MYVISCFWLLVFFFKKDLDIKRNIEQYTSKKKIYNEILVPTKFE